jgi:hypothetical protein
MDKMARWITRLVYGLLGILYVLIGVGSMLLPTGWLPQRLADDFLAGEIPSAFVSHLLQEFGTVVLALGLVFLWYATRKEQSRSFHWAMTLYFSLDALIHWVGPEGLIGSWRRGITNSIPAAVMLLLGLLQLRASERVRQSPPTEDDVE